MKAFHSRVFIPPELKKKIPNQLIILNYGPHAKKEAATDVLGPVENLPDKIDFSQAHIVEIVTAKKGIHKIVLKIPIDDTRDLAMVVNKDNVTKAPNTWFVRTVWVNKRADRNKEIPVYKYISEVDWKKRNETNI